MTDPFGVGPDHPRAISTDQITPSTHPHRHSYHGGSLSDAFPDDFGFQIYSTYNQAPFAQGAAAAGPSSLQGQAQQARPNPPAPAPVSVTGMHGQHSADGKVKTYACPLFSCGRLFKHMEHLKRHLRAHTMERPFTCAKCKRRFSTSCNLNQHLRTHNYRPSGGTDVAMNGSPEAGPGFAETFFRAGSPDFVAQTE